MTELFVTCGQGLEPLVAEELNEMGYPHIKQGFRGVHVESDDLGVYRINYCSRIASRVLIPIKRFKCYNAKTLYSAMQDVDWSSYIPLGKTFAIDANVTHTQLRNSLFAAQVVKDAICDQARQKSGQRPSVNLKNPDVQLNLFIRDNQGIIQFDTSGAPLTKRGYRIEGVEAPIHETLAAGLLRLAQYQGTEILCDPCCGSGTFLIEAALIASKTAPGYLRTKWGFMGMPNFDQTIWLNLKGEIDKQRVALKPAHFMGCDNNKNAIRIAKGNIRAAGFHQLIDVTVADFREYNPPMDPNFIIANPPHGRRLEDEETLKPLYRALGDFFKRKCAKPGKAFVFTGSMDLSKEVGLAPKKRHVVDNSGIESRFLEFDIF